MAVAQAHALLAEIAATVGPDVSGAEADEALSEVLGLGRQVDLLTCRLIERVDRTGQFGVDGAASTNGFVRSRINERAEWVSKRVAVGRALTDRLPVTAKTAEAGRLGLDHAYVIDHATRQLEPDLVAELDRILAEAAADGLDPTDLGRLAERVRAQTVPAEADKKAARQHRDQKVHASTTLGGMVNLTGRLDAEAGAIFQQALAFFTGKAPTREQILADPSSVEPVAWRRALGLVQMARHAMAHATGCNGDGTGRDTMIIGVGLDTLQSDVGVGAVAGGPQLTAGALRRLACDANIIPAVLGTRSEPLDLGRQTRITSYTIRAAVILRDGGCLFPGCQAPPSWCQCHHRRHWLHQGPTSKENLDLLCTRHHHLVHEGGWTLTVDNNPERTPWFHPPGGRPPIKGVRRPLIPPKRRR